MAQYLQILFFKKQYEEFWYSFRNVSHQVLTPVKTLFEFKAINITLGLPFLKITPDHGPNYKMLGKNKSDPSSIFYAFKFLNYLKWNLTLRKVRTEFLNNQK